MRVVFGDAFDQGAWPGPLDSRDAAYGEAWVGPIGLLGLLETGLGLAGPREVSAAERAASIVPALRAREGPWSRSLESDGDHLAVARAVLRIRDMLLLAGVPAHGVAEAQVGARLFALLEVARGVPPGLPERIAAVARAASRRPIDLERIELIDDAPWPLLRRALDVLASAGVQVVRRDIVPGPATGDLAQARAPRLAPRGDGSVQLLRCDCAEETAFAAAAHVAGLLRQDERARIVMVAPDDVLDGGLARLGLPTTGARSAARDDALLQVAPLVVALAWPERDPGRALELLSLPLSPIRRAVAARLSLALAKEPAVDSSRWREALAAALEALPEGERAHAARRVDDVFAAPVAGDAMTLALFEERLALVRRWLLGRATTHPEPAAPAALAQINHAGRIARALGGERLSRVEVMRVLAEATEAVRPPGPRPALAGFHVVADPAALTGPADHVLWWGFTSAAEEPAALPPLSAQERRGLLAVGATLATAAEAAERRSLACARPLLCATQTLLLACPARDARGEELHTHPLWDELVARAGGDQAVEPLVRRTSSFERRLDRKAFQRERPQPRSTWRVAAGVVPIAVSESPTSRETLLGCSFRAALLRAGIGLRGRALPDDRRLFGELAHAVLAEVLRASPVDGSHAAIIARSAFDQAVPKRAATLLRPEEKGRRLRARETVARAAERLLDTLVASGHQVRDVERELTFEKDGRVVRGRPDLIVVNPPVVIDLKSGRDARYREALEDGAAVQLIAYASLVRAIEHHWPEIAYFMVRSGRLFTTSEALGGAQAIDPPWTVEQAHRRLKRTVARVEGELAEGVLTSPGVGVAVPRAPDARDGELPVAPPCGACDLGTLCGRLLPGGAEQP